MPIFRIQTVEAERVTLQDAAGAPCVLPVSCFEKQPVIGQEIHLLIAPVAAGQPLPPSLARSVLNELLAPSAP